MGINIIGRKAEQLKELRKEAWELEKELIQDLIELDREAFDGLTWIQFLNSIKETVEVNERISIERENYRINGSYRIDENVRLDVRSSIHSDQTWYTPTMHYKDSGRYVESLPKKYQKQYDELVLEMMKFKVERPSDKFSKELRLASF